MRVEGVIQQYVAKELGRACRSAIKHDWTPTQRHPQMGPEGPKSSAKDALSAIFSKQLGSDFAWYPEISALFRWPQHSACVAPSLHINLCLASVILTISHQRSCLVHNKNVVKAEGGYPEGFLCLHVRISSRRPQEYPEICGFAQLIIYSKRWGG